MGSVSATNLRTAELDDGIKPVLSAVAISVASKNFPEPETTSHRTKCSPTLRYFLFDNMRVSPMETLKEPSTPWMVICAKASVANVRKQSIIPIKTRTSIFSPNTANLGGIVRIIYILFFQKAIGGLILLDFFVILCVKRERDFICS